MRVIIYGLGRRFFSIFSNQKIFDMAFVKDETEIIGFADKRSTMQGREILYDGQTFRVKDLQEFQISDFDKIVVTSKVYFDEIKDELIARGYEKEQILPVEVILEKYYDEVYHIEYYEHKVGLEIGGPTVSFSNIYNRCARCDGLNFLSKTVWWENKTDDYRYDDVVLGRIWIAEATDMREIEDKSYEFLLSSENLEHIANPLKALKEFSRVVKAGGIILVVVPGKNVSFDHNREYTTYNHLLEDYNNDIGEDDLSHLPEIIEKHDYERDVKCGGKKQFIERAKRNVENRCLHHHVFDEEGLRRSFEFAGIEVLKFSELINGNLVILGKNSLNI